MTDGSCAAVRVDGTSRAEVADAALLGAALPADELADAEIPDDELTADAVEATGAVAADFVSAAAGWRVAADAAAGWVKLPGLALPEASLVAAASVTEVGAVALEFQGTLEAFELEPLSSIGLAEGTDGAVPFRA